MRLAGRLAWALVLSAVASPQDGELDKGEVARIVDEYLAARELAAPPSPWEAALEGVSTYGDLRLRLETTDWADRRDRTRGRLRARFGASYEVDDSLLLGARLVTGSRDDPNSPHVTFGDGLDGLEVSLDRAFLTWRPREDVWVRGGKFAHPFRTNPVYGELVWDADVQPEGLAFGWGTDVGAGGARLELSAGEIVLVEQALDEDALMTVAQAALAVPLGDGVEGSFSASWHRVHDPTPDGSTLLVDDDQGNALVDDDGDGKADGFASDFGVLDVVAAARFDDTVPLQLSLEWIENLSAEDGEGSGWAAGVSWGRAARAGDWRWIVLLLRLEQDAVFSPFAQDDFPLVTDQEGALLGANHQLTDSAGLYVWALASDPLDDHEDASWRFRIDLNVKF